jgi:hypothetical protein
MRCQRRVSLLHSIVHGATSHSLNPPCMYASCTAQGSAEDVPILSKRAAKRVAKQAKWVALHACGAQQALHTA